MTATLLFAISISMQSECPRGYFPVNNGDTVVCAQMGDFGLNRNEDDLIGKTLQQIHIEAPRTLPIEEVSDAIFEEFLLTHKVLLFVDGKELKDSTRNEVLHCILYWNLTMEAGARSIDDLDIAILRDGKDDKVRVQFDGTDLGQDKHEQVVYGMCVDIHAKAHKYKMVNFLIKSG